MPGHEFFERLGLFIRPEFLETDLCARLRAEARVAPGKVGTFWRPSLQAEVADPEKRRRKEVLASATLLAPVQERVIALLPALSAHFGQPLAACQRPRLALYGAGDFLGPHADSAADAAAPAEITQRKVSVVIFASGEQGVPGPAAHRGGALTLYGLVPDPNWQSYGFPLAAEEGMLVAFPAQVLHEVKPVTEGERCVVTTWCY